MADNHEHLDNGHHPDDALQKIKTAGSISITPELFEKIYLSPFNKVKGELRGTFANPTPVALVGFLISLTPLTFDLMNFRGTLEGNGSASIGVYLGFGGICMILGGVGEFIVGNTFPMVVFTSFGGFWVAFHITLVPYYGAFGNYAGNSINVPYEGIEEPVFNNAFAWYLIWMGVLCLVYLICSIRTNLVFVMIFFFLVPAFACLAGGFMVNALAFEGVASATMGPALLKAGGALAFVVCVLGWYIFLAILLASLDFPFQIPVGDLSTVIKGASDRA